MTKKSKTIVFAAILPLVISGCLSQVNRELENVNRQMTASRTQAQREPEGSGIKTELVIPANLRTKQAMEAALPKIQEVLSIHRCIKTVDGLRLMNIHAVPGMIVERSSLNPSMQYPMSWMRYHNKNQCVSVRSIDEWSMPALNALQFRAVFFAQDSGETASYRMTFRKMDSGNWLLSDILHL